MAAKMIRRRTKRKPPDAPDYDMYFDLCEDRQAATYAARYSDQVNKPPVGFVFWSGSKLEYTIVTEQGFARIPEKDIVFSGGVFK